MKANHISWELVLSKYIDLLCHALVTVLRSDTPLTHDFGFLLGKSIASYAFVTYTNILVVVPLHQL